MRGSSRTFRCHSVVRHGQVEAEQVFNADAVPMPLRFDSLEQGLNYTYRTPGTSGIVQVADDGERVLVDTSTP